MLRSFLCLALTATFLEPCTIRMTCAADQHQTAKLDTAVVEQGAYDPTVSPDGSTIAVGILGKIWLLPASGGDAIQLSFAEGWDSHPSWSTDGRFVAYVHDTPTRTEIVMHAVATGATRTIHARTSEVGRPVFPFGRIVFHPTDGRLYFVDFRNGIWSVDPDSADGIPPRQLLSGSGRRPGRPGISEHSAFAFSPDGASIAVERDTVDQWSNLHIAMLRSLDFQRLTLNEKSRRTSVAWTADGKSLVFLELSGGRELLTIQPANGLGETRRFVLGPFNGRQLALFPDGNRAVVVSNRRLFVADLRSGDITPIRFRATFAFPTRAGGSLVITNAKLFDGKGSEILENATVEVRAGRIVAVTVGRYSHDSDVRVIDAGGRFLMPGLVDSHTHLWEGDKLSHAKVLARGVTSVLDLGSVLPETLNLRDAIRLGILRGPSIYTTGPTIDGALGRARSLTVANVVDPVDAAALVAELARAGVDAIKLYAFLEPDAVVAAVDAAHEAGIPVVGDHVATSWSAAIEAGIDGLVHLMDHKWRFISDAPPDSSEGPWAVVRPDSARMNMFFSEVAARNVMFDPTIMASSQYFRAAEFAAALDIVAGSDPADGATEADSASGTKPESTSLSLQPAERAAILADILRTMHRRGVRWVAGTDYGPSRLIDEMEIYEIAGIPNTAILQAATSNAARWLKRTDFGTIEPNRKADMVLIDGDPLARIRDLENVVLVVQAGRVVLEK